MRRYRAVTALLTAVLAVSGRPGTAQQAPGVGSRVRVTTPSDRVIGRLAALRGESIVIERIRGDRTQTVEIRKLEIQGLEVSQRPSRKARGAKIGALVGVGAAAAIGIWGGEECGAYPGPASWGNFTESLAHSLCIDHGEAGIYSALLTIPLGALLGYAVAPGERWRAARMPTVSVQPAVSRAGGAGLRVALSF